MTEESEEVLIQDGIPSSSRVREGGVQVAVISNIVMPAAKAGRDRSKWTAVIRTDQTNRGFSC